MISFALDFTVVNGCVLYTCIHKRSTINLYFLHKILRPPLSPDRPQLMEASVATSLAIFFCQVGYKTRSHGTILPPSKSILT